MTKEDFYKIRVIDLRMTQQELGRAMGVHHSSISLMESGKRRINIRTELALQQLKERCNEPKP